MELSTFIAQTLTEVMKGVTEAAQEQRASGRFGFINPMDGEQNDAFESIPISSVDFDVAVTVETSAAKQTSGGLVKVIEARTSRAGTERTLGESRVRFSVPVCLPTTKLTKTGAAHVTLPAPADQPSAF